MEHIDYFKLQAKNLHKDFETRFFNEKEKIYEYNPKFFDIGSLFSDYGIPDDKADFTFTLMNAQHLIAKMAGYENWGELKKAPEPELKLRHIVFDSVHKLTFDEWNMYIQNYEKENHICLSWKEKLEIIQKNFMNEIIQKNFMNGDNTSKQKLLPAPKNLYAFMLPILGGFKITFSFDAVEYAQSYLVYSSEINDVSTATPLAAGQFSPIEYVAHHQKYMPYYWVRAFDGKEYGEWSSIAMRNR